MLALLRFSGRCVLDVHRTEAAQSHCPGCQSASVVLKVKTVITNVLGSLLLQRECVLIQLATAANSVTMATTETRGRERKAAALCWCLHTRLHHQTRRDRHSIGFMV